MKTGDIELSFIPRLEVWRWSIAKSGEPLFRQLQSWTLEPDIICRFALLRLPKKRATVNNMPAVLFVVDWDQNGRSDGGHRLMPVIELHEAFVVHSVNYGQSNRQLRVLPTDLPRLMVAIDRAMEGR